MALQYSTTLRDAQLDAVESTLGTSAILEIWSGTEPADADTADGAGDILCSITLPSDWMAAASGGSKAKSGTWSGTGTSAAGTGTDATYFRLTTSGGTVHMQGTVTATGGGGDMTVDNISIAESQTVVVSTFTLTAGNA